MKQLLSILACVVVFSTLSLAADVTDAILDEINLARTQPQAYAAILQQQMAPESGRMAADLAEAVRFLQKQRPMCALGRVPGLDAAARLHVQTLGPVGGNGHGNPLARLAKFGKWLGSAGEAIYYGPRDARGIVCAWIVDHKVADRGHRKSLFNPTFTVAGLSYGDHARFRSMAVVDFAGGYLTNRGVLASL